MNNFANSKFATFDLNMIKSKLTHPEEGEGWTDAFANSVEGDYRRFLYLNAKYKNATLVPSKLVDTFWHAHILDTRKYAHDSGDLFGEFFHHFPYFGIRGDDDEVRHREAFVETQKLWLREFGTVQDAHTGIEFSGKAATCKGICCCDLIALVKIA
ncbi:MAG TPA: hypothetical protein VFM02_03400 [Candidatus Paceibacterota bacterium]|nr:hypothetical protein [Candidatus Paceibacterota bacterium]